MFKNKNEITTNDLIKLHKKLGFYKNEEKVNENGN